MRDRDAFREIEERLDRLERRVKRAALSTFEPFAVVNPPNPLWAGEGKAAYGGQPNQFAIFGGGQGSWGLPGLPGAAGFGGSAGPSTE